MKRREVIVFALVFLLASLVIATGGFALAAKARKVQLPRDDVYYDVVNDADDQGNFVLQFHVPVPGTSRKVYCTAYKDHTSDGAMGGWSCDWVGFHKNDK